MVVLPGAVDADDGNDGRAVRGLDQVRPAGRQIFFHLRPGDGEDIQARTALGFVGVFHGRDDLRGHGQAEVGGDERGFEFFERRGVQLGRTRDDAFDFVRQPAVGFLQAGFEFGEEAHASMRCAECGTRSFRARPAARDLRLEPFDVFVGQLDGADERLALAEAVAIGTAGDEQVELVGDFQVTLGQRGGMLGVKTFDAVQPGVHERRNDFVRAVQSGMRHDGEAAGLVNQFDALQRGHLGLGHPGGPVLFEKPLERLVQVLDQAGLHQRAGHVRPAGRLAVGQRKDRFHLERARSRH